MMEKRTYCADLGDGTYRNPILHGDYPDPAILKDGEDYYLVNCYQPMVWHSMDLLHWEPLYELPYSVGGAADICKYGDTYYIYNIDPFRRDEADYKASSVMVLTTQDIKSGHWDGPFYVGPAFNILGGHELIDPGHVVDFEGRRWLYMSENVCFPLTQDGLHFAGPGKRVLADEVFPDDWEIQGVYTEGPRFTLKDGWIYLTIAAGGTMGPPTSHGVFSYRSKHADGPWEPSPYNPIIRTHSRHERWISKGHGTLVEAPDGSWYMMYHAFLNNRFNQGRMMLMEPVEWTEDGWYRIPEWSGADKVLPAPKGGKAVPHGYPTHVQFPNEDLPCQWYYTGRVKERIRKVEDGIVMQGSGTSLHDSDGVMAYNALYENFEVITRVTVGNGAGCGISMYYSPSHAVGFALKDGFTWVFNCGHANLQRHFSGVEYLWDQAYLKLTVRHQVVSLWISADGEQWTKLPPSFNIAHLSHMAYIPRGEIRGMGMYPALFTYGTGEATFHEFTIRELKLED